MLLSHVELSRFSDGVSNQFHNTFSCLVKFDEKFYKTDKATYVEIAGFEETKYLWKLTKILGTYNVDTILPENLVSVRVWDGK